MKLPLLITSGLERVIASVLDMDPDTQSRLQSLDGKVIRINVLNPSLSLTVSIVDGRVQLDSIDEHDTIIADTTITGRLSALRSLAGSNDAVYRGDVQIEGDIDTSQQVKQLVAGLDPDWQEAVSGYLGDGITHKLDVAQQGFLQWLDRTRHSARSNTSEYLQEELEVLAPNSCVEQFNDHVDQLRADADRLSARIKRLENKAHVQSIKE